MFIVPSSIQHYKRYSIEQSNCGCKSCRNTRMRSAKARFFLRRFFLQTPRSMPTAKAEGSRRSEATYRYVSSRPFGMPRLDVRNPDGVRRQHPPKTKGSALGILRGTDTRDPWACCWEGCRVLAMRCVVASLVASDAVVTGRGEN